MAIINPGQWRTLVFGFVSLVLVLTKSLQTSEAKTVSQCHGSRSFTFVSLYCGFKKVIQIQRAFHGAHKNEVISHCGYLAEDCTMDTTHLYDWGQCEGKHSCVQMIDPRQLEPCPQRQMAYLQVHYACVPGTAYIARKSTTTTERVTDPPPSVDINQLGEATDFLLPVQGRKPEASPQKPGSSSTAAISTTHSSAEAYSICTNKTWTASEVSITSPGFPDFYPADTECRCVVKGLSDSKVAVTYQALSLVMRGGQCVDWLLLQSLGFKDSAAVTCGQMLGKEKTLMGKGNWLLMHFHTARGSTARSTSDVRNMQGFKVKVKTQPKGPFDIQCYPTPPEVLQTLKYKDSQRSTGSVHTSGSLLMCVVLLLAAQVYSPA